MHERRCEQDVEKFRCDVIETEDQMLIDMPLLQHAIFRSRGVPALLTSHLLIDFISSSVLSSFFLLFLISDREASKKKKG